MKQGLYLLLQCNFKFIIIISIIIIAIIIIIIIMALQSSVDINLFQNCRPVSKFKISSTEHFFYGMGFFPHAQPRNLEDQGIPFSLGHHL